VRPARPRRSIISISLFIGGALLGGAFTPISQPIAAIFTSIATFGLFGLINFGWSRCHSAQDALSALPFPVTHDRPDALGYSSPRRILSVTLHLRTPLDAPSRDVIAGPLPPQAHLGGKYEDRRMPRRPRTIESTAEYHLISRFVDREWFIESAASATSTWSCWGVLSKTPIGVSMRTP
jgi:hypothetical protein